MTMLSAFLVALGLPAVTINSNWGFASGASPIESASRTFQSSGTIKFTSVSTDGTFQYKINAGSYTTVVDNATLAVTAGQSLTFKLTGTAAGASCTVLDNNFGTTVGDVSLSTF